MRRPSAVALFGLLAGCAQPLGVPHEGGVVRVFQGQRVVGHYISPDAYRRYILAQLASIEGRSQDAVDELRRALSSDGDSAYLRTRLAEELIALGRLDEARDEVDSALRLEPNFAEAYVNLGRIQVRLGDATAAEASFRRAFDVDRTCEEAYLSLAALYRERGDAGRADGVLRTLADRLPGSARAHWNLAHTAAGRGDLAGAEAELRRALTLDPAMIEARLELADLLRADGRAADAVVELKMAWDRGGREPKLAAPLVAAQIAAGHADEAQALLDGLYDSAVAPDKEGARSLAGGSPERRLAIGWLFVQLHQNQRALAVADALLKIADTPAAHLLRGAALDEAGQADAALAELRRVPPSSPDSPAAQLRAARILRDAARFDEAAQILARALGATPADPDAYTELLAQVHERAGNRAQAQRVLEGALRTRESEVLGFALASLLERSGDVGRAVEIARAMLKRSPEHAGALHFIGHAWARSSGKLADAEKLLERAARLRPTSGEIAGTLGWVYLQQNRLDEAQRALERAERMVPEDPEVLAHLGDLYLQRDDRARALATYRRALAHRPDGNVRHAVEEQLLLLENGRVGAR